jgi:hypothetical protein
MEEQQSRTGGQRFKAQLLLPSPIQRLQLSIDSQILDSDTS